MQLDSVFVRSGWRGQNINGWRMDFGERAKVQTLIFDPDAENIGPCRTVFENTREVRMS
jgi:hypothetical protein